MVLPELSGIIYSSKLLNTMIKEKEEIVGMWRTVFDRELLP